MVAAAAAAAADDDDGDVFVVVEKTQSMADQSCSATKTLTATEKHPAKRKRKISTAGAGRYPLYGNEERDDDVDPLRLLRRLWLRSSGVDVDGNDDADGVNLERSLSEDTVGIVSTEA
jgi:hypothetical protein